MSCPLCCTDQIQQSFEKQGVPYYRCLACDFVFSKPSRNANLTNEIDDYEAAYSKYLAESEEDEWNHAALLRWAERFCSLNGQRVLDIGCGSGKFVRFLRRTNVDAFGLEPATPLFSRYLATDPFFVHQTFEEYAEESTSDQFEVIFASDVIEHVERPDLFLRDASVLLRPGGTLFISTPDVGSVFARVCGRWWHFYNRYHLSYLSRSTMVAMAVRHGLREVGYAHLSRQKSIGYALQYLSDFIVGAGSIRIPDRLDRFLVPLNLFDIMSVVFQKRPNPSAANTLVGNGPPNKSLNRTVASSGRLA